MVVTFTSVFETLVFGHSSESYWAALSSGTVYYDVQSGSNFQVCRQHPSLAFSSCCLLGNSTQIRCLFSKYDLNFIFLGVVIYYSLTLRSNLITLFTCAKSLWGQKNCSLTIFHFIPIPNVRNLWIENGRLRWNGAAQVFIVTLDWKTVLTQHKGQVTRALLTTCLVTFLNASDFAGVCKITSFKSSFECDLG